MYHDEMVKVLQEGVTSLVGQWGLSPETAVELLTVSENATFKAVDPTDERQLILRVHRPGYHSVAEIESELSWIDALRQDEIVRIPAPIRTIAGQKVSRFATGQGPRDVVAFEFVPGEEPAADASLIDGFHQLGVVSARLHQHARSWARPAEFARKTWNFDTTLGDKPLWGDWRAAMGLAAEGKKLLSEACADINTKLDHYGQAADRFGLIHADLRLANLLVDGDQLAVIDFDDCGLSWFMYDFAAAISFIEEDPLVDDLQASWIKGYRSVARISDEDEAMLPTFIMLRRILLTAWLASHAETPTAKELGSDYTVGTLRLAEEYLGRDG